MLRDGQPPADPNASPSSRLPARPAWSSFLRGSAAGSGSDPHDPGHDQGHPAPGRGDGRHRTPSFDGLAPPRASTRSSRCCSPVATEARARPRSRTPTSRARRGPSSSWRRATPGGAAALPRRAAHRPTPASSRPGDRRSVGPAAHDRRRPRPRCVGNGVWVVDEDPDQWDRRQVGNTAHAAVRRPRRCAAWGCPLRPRPDAGDPGQPRETSQGYAELGQQRQRGGRALLRSRARDGCIPGRFMARSLVVDLVSTNGRAFSEPPQYGQSLIADLLHLGATAAAGSVLEPTLSGVSPRPTSCSRTTRGACPPGEAFFRSVPYLGWASFYVGDPADDRAANRPPTIRGSGRRRRRRRARQLPLAAELRPARHGRRRLRQPLRSGSSTATAWSKVRGRPGRAVPMACPES